MACPAIWRAAAVKPVHSVLPDTPQASGFRAGSRPIAGQASSHGLRPESTAGRGASQAACPRRAWARSPRSASAEGVGARLPAKRPVHPPHLQRLNHRNRGQARSYGLRPESNARPHHDPLLPKAWELACLRSGAQRQRNLCIRFYLTHLRRMVSRPLRSDATPAPSQDKPAPTACGQNQKAAAKRRTRTACGPNQMPGRTAIRFCRRRGSWLACDLARSGSKPEDAIFLTPLGREVS